jgi:hypothetical protein
VSSERSGSPVKSPQVFDLEFRPGGKLLSRALPQGEGTGKGTLTYAYFVGGALAPGEITMQRDGGTRHFGLYKVERGRLSLCLTGPGAAEEDRPRKFDTKGTSNVLHVFERIDEKKEAARRVLAPPEELQLGTVRVGPYAGFVYFQHPAEDGKSYRVTLAIPKPAADPLLKAERFDVWLLARGGKGLALASRDRPEGVLVEAGNARGVTANAAFFFRPQARRAELVAVVVSVDGVLTTLKVPVLTTLKVPPAAAKKGGP